MGTLSTGNRTQNPPVPSVILKNIPPPNCLKLTTEFFLKFKVAKKSQFTLKRKKSKSEVDYANLVCPLETSPPGTPTSNNSSATASPNLNSPSI